MIRVLSTKKLKSNQKQFMLNAGFSVLEANFIETKSRQFSISEVKENLIFTSQNAVSSFLENENSTDLQSKNCFCVGLKTKSLLENIGFTVVEVADYASDLAEKIVAKFKNESFTFFSGNLRQDALPQILKSSQVDFNEIEVYETKLTPKPIKANLNGILFFSPSAVESYLSANEITNEICFCIGTSTAKSLENVTENIVIANQPSIENTIIQTIKFLSKTEQQTIKDIK